MSDPALAIGRAVALCREAAATGAPVTLSGEAAAALADLLGVHWHHMQEWGYRTHGYDAALALSRLVIATEATPVTDEGHERRQP